MKRFKWHKKEQVLVIFDEDKKDWFYEIHFDLDKNYLFFHVVQEQFDGEYTPIKVEMNFANKDGESHNSVFVKLGVGTNSFNDVALLQIDSKTDDDQPRSTDIIEIKRENVTRIIEEMNVGV